MHNKTNNNNNNNDNDDDNDDDNYFTKYEYNSVLVFCLISHTKQV